MKKQYEIQIENSHEGEFISLQKSNTWELVIFPQGETSIV